MKIQLERKLSSCSEKLICTVCNQWFEPDKIRTLLYTDRGLLLGDVCRVCLKLPASEIRDQLRERASLLLQQSELLALPDWQNTACRARALELLQAAQEDVRFPSIFDWWFKKLEIFSEESQALEATRVGLNEYYLMERSRLQKILDDDRD